MFSSSTPFSAPTNEIFTTNLKNLVPFVPQKFHFWGKQELSWAKNQVLGSKAGTVLVPQILPKQNVLPIHKFEKFVVKFLFLSHKTKFCGIGWTSLWGWM